jgi:hypothetical protein
METIFTMGESALEPCCCAVVPFGILCLILYANLPLSKEEAEETQRRLDARIKILEEKARQGDLIAYKEWKDLTGQSKGGSWFFFWWS